MSNTRQYTEKAIRDALRRVWAAATRQPKQPGERSLMSLPVDEDNDADCILYGAIDELIERRKQDDKADQQEPGGD